MKSMCNGATAERVGEKRLFGLALKESTIRATIVFRSMMPKTCKLEICGFR